MHEMSLQTEPPLGPTSQTSVGPHISMSQVLFTHVPEPFWASQCWSASQATPSHGSPWVLVVVPAAPATSVPAVPLVPLAPPVPPVPPAAEEPPVPVGGGVTNSGSPQAARERGS